MLLGVVPIPRLPLELNITSLLLWLLIWNEPFVLSVNKYVLYVFDNKCSTALSVLEFWCILILPSYTVNFSLGDDVPIPTLPLTNDIVCIEPDVTVLFWVPSHT